MSKLVKIFNFQESEVRTLVIDEEIWFVAKDVADILGYSKTNRMICRLDEDEKKKVKGTVVVPLTTVGVVARFGNNDVIIINESGLYNAVLGSKNPQAKVFKKWVTSEVIPSIRKTGGYGNQELSRKQLAQMVIDAEEEKERLQLENSSQKKLLTEYAPKASYYDKILKSIDTMTITEIAKDYGLTARKLNKILHDKKVQYKQKINGTWLLYATHAGNGYTKTDTIHYEHTDGSDGSTIHMRWTQKGRLFIHDILTKLGYSAD